MNLIKWTVLIAFVLGGLFSLRTASAEETPALKNIFAKDFLVGVALGTRQVTGEEPKALDLVKQQFNSISPENLLKFEEIHPEPDVYNWEPADKYVEFGEQNGMFIVGHTLVWHNQTPDWVFEGENGQTVDRETLLKRMRDHIHTVVGRYKGRIKGWDVVNEAVEDNGQMRKTKWYEIIGEDYIDKAFEYAHEADPDCELYYNDYNEFNPAKRKTICEIVKKLKANGRRIDGVGCQGHYALDYPTAQELEQTIRMYAGLGVKVHITELDINVLPSPGAGQQGADITQNYELKKELDPYAASLPEDIQKKLATKYASIFMVLVKNKDVVDRVTFWGVHDGHSWHNNWPVPGRTAHSLLFDRNYQPKPAFWAVIKTAK